VPGGCARSRIQQQLSFLSLHRVAGSRIKPRLEAAFFFYAAFERLELQSSSKLRCLGAASNMY
jgi:hypothetical protein